jgi:hypothetical protein
VPNQSERNCGHFAAVVKFAMALVLVLAAAGTAAGQIIYNSIPSPLPGNVGSEGPEAYAFRELGDGLVFTAGTPRSLATVKVVLSDWACTSGNWFNPIGKPNPCVTSPAGATFSQPITINIYSVVGTTPGPLLFTKTATFKIPYRPSSDAVHCVPGGIPGGDGEQWYSPADNTCYHGLAFPITFDFSADGVVLPDQAIITIAFNSTHYGPSPIGQGAACFSTTEGCPYDSLNISTDGSPTVGNNVDPNGIYFNYYFTNSGCTKPNPTNVLFDDTPCWAGGHPEILVDTTPGDTLQIGYAANLNAGDSIVDFTSAGAIGGTDPAGDICANIYVFDDLQEMIACCSCSLTPNHLAGVSVKKDLISNLLTPGSPPTAVTIAVTASSGSSCNAAQVVSYAPGLRAWGTTLHAKPGGGFASTETPFLTASPSVSELTKLTSYCGFIQATGSGHGICDSCSPGAGGGGGGGGGGGSQGPPQ